MVLDFSGARLRLSYQSDESGDTGGDASDDDRKARAPQGTPSCPG